ncbi:MAG TPA: alpha/beta fold hydrolase [bacterium]|nr:alpha/beta fold hydrolase [bacterium]
MYALTMGAGPAVLLVHGFGGAAESWYFNTEPLSARFQVVAVDLPGFGRSSTQVQEPVLDYFVSGLLTVLEHLRIPTCHVVGNSMGGAVALRMAQLHSQRVEKLVLVDPVGLGADISGGFLRDLIAASTAEQVRAVLTQVFHDPVWVSDQAVERILRYKARPGAQQVLSQVGAALFDGERSRMDFREHLSRISHPTLVLWGRQDRVIPPAHAEAASAMPRAQVHLIDACGHLPQMEAQEPFHALVSAFLNAGDSSPA